MVTNSQGGYKLVQLWVLVKGSKAVLPVRFQPEIRESIPKRNCIISSLMELHDSLVREFPAELRAVWEQMQIPLGNASADSRYRLMPNVKFRQLDFGRSSLHAWLACLKDSIGTVVFK